MCKRYFIPFIIRIPLLMFRNIVFICRDHSFCSYLITLRQRHFLTNKEVNLYLQIAVKRTCKYWINIDMNKRFDLKKWFVHIMKKVRESLTLFIDYIHVHDFFRLAPCTHICLTNEITKKTCCDSTSRKRLLLQEVIGK